MFNIYRYNLKLDVIYRYTILAQFLFIFISFIVVFVFEKHMII